MVTSERQAIFDRVASETEAKRLNLYRQSLSNLSMPTDPASRKATPIAEGVLWYFPNALAAIAAVSKAGNDQHNPGQPMHHSRGKSSDHADCILRHLIDAGTMDSDGLRHSAKVAWRALALLQEEIERDEGVPLPRNARYDTKEVNDGQAPTNPVPAGDRQIPLFPVGRREETTGDMAGNRAAVYDSRGRPSFSNADERRARDEGVERRGPCG